jgi:hypothetical protein
VQAPPELDCFDTNDRVDLRVVVQRAVVNGNADRMFFKLFTAERKSFTDNKCQEFL